MPHNHREQKKPTTTTTVYAFTTSNRLCAHDMCSVGFNIFVLVLLFLPFFRMRCNDTNINVDCIMLNRFIFGVPICIGEDVYCRSLSLFHYIYQNITDTHL